MRPTDLDFISLIERQLSKSCGTKRFDGAVDPAELMKD